MGLFFFSVYTVLFLYPTVILPGLYTLVNTYNDASVPFWNTEASISSYWTRAPQQVYVQFDFFIDIKVFHQWLCHPKE